jgi:hypothetical protein
MPITTDVVSSYLDQFVGDLQQVVVLSGSSGCLH